MITSTIDTSGMTEVMNGLSSALIDSGKDCDAANILKDESRKLSKQIVNYTPPLRSSHGSPKTSGEMAIDGELHSLFSEANESLIDEIWAQHGLHDINTFINRPQGDKLNLRWQNLDPMGDGIEDKHQQNKTSRGKVRKSKHRYEPGVWFARYVVPKGTLEPYIKKLKKRVGRWRASWALAASQMGEKFPSWITRHFGSINDIATAKVEGLNNRHWPTVTFGSSAPGNSRQGGIIQASVTKRGKAIASRIRLVLSGYRKDIAAGIRHPRKRAQETASPEMVVVE